MDILVYQKEARTYFLYYVLVVFGLTFIAAALSVDPAQHCKDNNCPNWLWWVALIVGGLALLGGLVAIIKNFRWGSRIDVDAGVLYWWEGYQPLKEHQIDLKLVEQIVIENSTGDSHLKVLAKDEKRILFSEQCAPWPWQDWAQEIANKFPHIQIKDNN